MNFKMTLFPDVKALTSTLRVRPSTKINELNQRVTNWRVSPVTGQLEQRCTFSDTEDPQSRTFSA